MASTTSYAELYNDIRDIERDLAYGSQTSMWSDFIDRMDKLGIRSPMQPDCEDDEQLIDSVEAAWWRQAYTLLQADPSRDVQDIYNEVG